jgi:outer membrane protein
MDMKQIFFTICLILGVSSSAFSQDQKQWTLSECIDYALKNNISVKQSELDIDAADLNKSDAFWNFFPTLNGNISNTWNTGLTQNITTGVLQNQTTRNSSFGATAAVTLFNGLNNLRRFQRAKIAKLASKYSLGQIRNDITLTVANQFLDILINKERVDVLQKQNKVTQDQIAQTQKQVDAGAVPEGELLQIKATNADEQQQIIQARNAVKIARISLAQTLLIKDYENFNIIDSKFTLPSKEILSKAPREIVQQAKEERYEIKIAQQDVELSKKDVQLARGNYYPTLSAFINYNTRESGASRFGQGKLDPDSPTQVIGQVESSGEAVVAPNFSTNSLSARPFFDQLSRNDGLGYGFQLRIPIFNGFSTRNSVKRNEINVKRSENQLEQAELDLESNVYQAYVDAQGAAKSYEAAQAAVTSQQKAFDYSQKRYDVGLINSLDFTQSKFRLTDAKNRLVQAKYNLIFNIKVLELFFGVDPEDLKL